MLHHTTTPSVCRWEYQGYIAELRGDKAICISPDGREIDVSEISPEFLEEMKHGMHIEKINEWLNWNRKQDSPKRAELFSSIEAAQDNASYYEAISAR